MDEPLVSIVVPTYNSEKTLPLCLESVKRQTYRNIEVIIVDSYSRDKTIEIAKKYSVRIIQTHGGLLWARYLGHLHAKGDIELLLDSDQILNITTIEHGVKMILKGYDMLILEEKSYKPKTLVQWLFYFDRKHIHSIKDLHPIHGVLLARMYKRSVLGKAFDSIKKKLPLQIMFKLVSQDHALIYYESWKYTNNVGILKDALYHIEPTSLTQIVKKFYRYSKTEFNLSKYYPKLAKGKKSPRKPSLSPYSIASLTLWILKAIPYGIGRFTSYDRP